MPDRVRSSHPDVTLRVRLALIFLWLLLLPAALRSQDAARITGRVTAADMQLPLLCARVGVIGLGRVTGAGDGGLYASPRVGAGRVALPTPLLGRAPRTLESTDPSSGTITADFALDAVSLAPVTVRNSGQAEAPSRQKNAANIKNIVAPEQMGRFTGRNFGSGILRQQATGSRSSPARTRVATGWRRIRATA